MKITLNGSSHSLENIKNINDLLKQQGHYGKMVAVELNGDIVPKSQHETTALNNGDNIEIVMAVGGG